MKSMQGRLTGRSTREILSILFALSKSFMTLNKNVLSYQDRLHWKNVLGIKWQRQSLFCCLRWNFSHVSLLPVLSWNVLHLKIWKCALRPHTVWGSYLRKSTLFPLSFLFIEQEMETENERVTLQFFAKHHNRKRKSRKWSKRRILRGDPVTVASHVFLLHFKYETGVISIKDSKSIPDRKFCQESNGRNGGNTWWTKSQQRVERQLSLTTKGEKTVTRTEISQFLNKSKNQQRLTRLLRPWKKTWNG